MRTCIGFDIGRSAVKIVASYGQNSRAEIIFPSSACPAFQLHDDREAELATADTVLIGQQAYFIGDTAMLQGRDDLTGGLRDDWAKSERHAALFAGGLSKLKAHGVPGLDHALVMLGLPAAHFASQKTSLAHEMQRLAPNIELRVRPQPMGPYYQMMFDTAGREVPNFNADSAKWAVVEIGQYTTDYALVLDGRTIENAFGSCDGMRIAAEHLQRTLAARNFAVPLVEATSLLETKSLRNFGSQHDISKDVDQAVAPLAAMILDKANQLIGRSARTLDGVLIAGGGASLVMPALQKIWPHAVLADKPRFAVAEGFCRFAVAYETFRRTQPRTGTGG